MISLSPTDLALAALLVALDAAVSVALKLQLHRQLLWAATRMVTQLIAVGFLLRFIFALNNPWATLAIVVVISRMRASIAGSPARTRCRMKPVGETTITLRKVVLKWLRVSKPTE